MQNVQFLRQKLCLMALIELVFKRPGNDRRISFQIIAQETRLPVDDVCVIEFGVHADI